MLFLWVSGWVFSSVATRGAYKLPWLCLLLVLCYILLGGVLQSLMTRHSLGHSCAPFVCSFIPLDGVVFFSSMMSVLMGILSSSYDRMVLFIIIFEVPSSISSASWVVANLVTLRSVIVGSCTVLVGCVLGLLVIGTPVIISTTCMIFRDIFSCVGLFPFSNLL